jgi:hypothetical protein
MNFKTSLFFLFILTFSLAQTTEKIKTPKHVVYTYATDEINQIAKKLIAESLSQKDNFKLIDQPLIIGPTLWKRFKEMDALNEISGNVVFHIDDMKFDGKMSQTIGDSQKIWNAFRNEISENYEIRKLKEDELIYYWATISFDIEEPLLAIDTKNRIYLLNFEKESMKLFWIDEFPLMKSYQNPIDNGTYETNGTFKSYKNGEEIFIKDKGVKETKIETVILLSSDAEIIANSSVEDISSIIDKTNKIFEELFKNSEKEGKIMIQFELGKKKNNIQFAVRDNLDLEIMKEFEKRVNAEKFPKSKKDPIKFQLIYKVNSYDDDVK